MSRNYTDFINDYVHTFGPKGEAPERYHYWTAVHTIGGVLRRRVYLDAGTSRWFPNFYTILVGPPGVVKKSTVINIGSRMLRELRDRPGCTINVGADCTTWQSFVKEVAEAKDMFAEGNISETDLLNQTYSVTSAISLQISELGTFLDPRDKAMIEILTELYDGKLDQEWIKRTKTQGEDQIMNPFVNIIAGTTPAWMNDNFRAQLGGWGLSSRCIFIHADRPDRLIALPHKMWKGEFEATLAKFTDDLERIAQLSGVAALDHEAEWFYEQWYLEQGKRHQAMVSHPHHDKWLSYYLARKAPHMLKLALILSAGRRDSLVVTIEDIKEAILRCDQVEEEISLIFKGKDVLDERIKLRRDVWNGICHLIIHAGGELEEWKIHNYCRGWMSGGDAKQLVDQMMNARYLLRRQHDAETYFTFGEGAVFNRNELAQTLGADAVDAFLEQNEVRMEENEPPLQAPPANPAPDHRLVPRYEHPQQHSEAHVSETLPSTDPSPDFPEEFVPPYVSPEEDPEVPQPV